MQARRWSFQSRGIKLVCVTKKQIDYYERILNLFELNFENGLILGVSVILSDYKMSSAKLQCIISGEFNYFCVPNVLCICICILLGTFKAFSGFEGEFL